VSVAGGISLAFQGLLPSLPLFLLGDVALRWELVVFVPCLVMYFLYLKIWNTLRGYTGDCCGALFLLVELSAYLMICITAEQV
jgi:adenosylcobinamide-GDP ribazoletransferase